MIDEDIFFLFRQFFFPINYVPLLLLIISNDKDKDV